VTASSANTSSCPSLTYITRSMTIGETSNSASGSSTPVWNTHATRRPPTFMGLIRSTF
jgi:hypothetical protein